jgi:hypothetical protein
MEYPVDRSAVDPFDQGVSLAAVASRQRDAYRSCSVGRIRISLTATCRGRVTM